MFRAVFWGAAVLMRISVVSVIVNDTDSVIVDFVVVLLLLVLILIWFVLFWYCY